MTSAINPNNIDTAYPVAGQDNNTQGFRNNFTNIKNNFEEARDEITQLQIVSAVKGNDAVNDFAGGIIDNARIQNLSASAVNLGAVSGPIGINYAAGHYQQMSTSGSVVLSFTNLPSDGQYRFVRVAINVTSAAHTVTLPGPGSGVTVNRQGIQGLDTTSNVITFATAGVYTFDFTTTGSGITIDETNNQLRAFNNSSEDLAPSAAASLATTTSYFTTAGAETATLAAGVEGQIKVFAMVATGGNMVITVANAGWKTSGTGTITFDAVGDACTLQYVNAKWFCIGNNGCVFA
jgi:hypothetical protein